MQKAYPMEKVGGIIREIEEQFGIGSSRDALSS
jgi:hypothetical protein